MPLISLSLSALTNTLTYNEYWLAASGKDESKIKTHGVGADLQTWKVQRFHSKEIEDRANPCRIKPITRI